MKTLGMVTGALLILAGAVAVARDTPYAGLQEREIKALSGETVSQYLGGAGMSMALAAELNGYPGPRHVLELSTDLKLTPAQIQTVSGARELMTAEARRLGLAIVTLERELDRLFADGEADEASIDALSSKIGTLNGELRAAHLGAHVTVRAAMTPEQIATYNRLRGYDKPAADRHQHHAGHSGH